MKIQLTDLTLGDLEEFEKAGGSMEDLTSGTMTAGALVALVYVAGRREDPEFSREQAARVKFTEVELVAQDPTPAGD